MDPALSYTQGETDTPLLTETIGENFRRNVAAHPQEDAIVEAETGRQWDYTQMRADVDVIARALMGLGVKAGDRVGIWSPNCAEWTLIQYATATMGAILVNINPAYRTHELTFALNQCELRTLILAPRDRHTNYLQMALSVAHEVPAMTEIVQLPEADNAPEAGQTEAWPTSQRRPAEASLELPATLTVEQAPALYDWAEFIEQSATVSQTQLDAQLASLDPADEINLQYTSGTTGFPKGATLTHANLINNGYSIGELLGYTPEDKVVLPVPFFHCFGMVIGNLAAYSHGSATILPSRQFKPEPVLAAIQKYGGTSLYGVPTMFIAELGLPNFDDYDVSTLRTGVMAGSNCPVEVMKDVIDRMYMKEVAICYGMTETAPVSTMTRVDDNLVRRTETVGRTMPHLETKIISVQDGSILPRGAVGELCTRGYSVMSKYWNDPDKTAEAVDAEGWMHTGDLASMDEHGYVKIEGRIKDMIIRGGENISPREIEEFLYTHPSIQDVQVIGVPDEKYGEELMAAVILKDGAGALNAEDIREFCFGKLAHYKIPKYVQLRESFPMTVSGKIRKVEMREEYISRID